MKISRLLITMIISPGRYVLRKYPSLRLGVVGIHAKKPVVVIMLKKATGELTKKNMKIIRNFMRILIIFWPVFSMKQLLQLMSMASMK